MCAWGRKGCVGVAEVSLGLMPLLPSSFQGSLGPHESPQTPQRSLVGGDWSGGASLWHDGGCQALRTSVSKDTEQKLRISQVAPVLILTHSSPIWGRWGG